jgi:hypothetical protein
MIKEKKIQTISIESQEQLDKTSRLLDGVKLEHRLQKEANHQQECRLNKMIDDMKTKNLKLEAIVSFVHYPLRRRPYI